MDALTLKEILKSDYGINNEEEFNAAVRKSAGINLRIFTMPLTERGGYSEPKDAEKITA